MNKQQFRKKLGIKNPMEMWKLTKEEYIKDDFGYYKKDENGRLLKKEVDYLYLVNTETGRTQVFIENETFIQEGIRDHDYDTEYYYKGNGFKRMRLAEDGLKEVKEELEE